jgi:hypothetical protein
LRQRRHARVENAITAPRDTGLDRMPFRRFAAYQAWLGLVLTGADLLAWLRSVADGELARAEHTTLRYRLLQAAARIVRGPARSCSVFPRTGPGRRANQGLPPGQAPRHLRT